MNKFFLTLLLSGAACTAFAQIQGSGYYRVKNLSKGRYALVCDNQSDGANIQQSTADLTAVRLRKGHDATISDPASVIYIDDKGDGNYDLKAQGTGVYQMIGYYPNVYTVKDNVYNVYAVISGMGTKYLSDNDETDDEYGIMDLDGKGTKRQWSVYKLNTTSDEYFGVRPTVSAGGKQYATLYADFPFSFYSSGMKAYTIQSVDNTLGVAVIAEVTAATIPTSTPVIIECGSATPAGNRLDLKTGSFAPLTGNILKGCYFCYSFKRKKSPDAVTKYDPATMRVLSTLSDGSLGFAQVPLVDDEEDEDGLLYMPANQCWLPVTADTPAQLKLVTPEEYAVMGMDAIKAERNGTAGIYSVAGTLLSTDITQLGNLPKGVYIVNGRKVIK